MPNDTEILNKGLIERIRTNLDLARHAGAVAIVCALSTGAAVGNLAANIGNHGPARLLSAGLALCFGGATLILSVWARDRVSDVDSDVARIATVAEQPSNEAAEVVADETDVA